MHTIWICDDEEALLLFLQERLQAQYQNRIRVQTFPSGRALLSQAAQQLPDILLMDIALGKEDGIRLANRICAEFAKKPVKVIFMTAYPLEYCQKIFFGTLKPDAFLTKPLCEDYLFRQMDACMQALASPPQDGPLFTYQKGRTVCSIPCQTIIALESAGHMVSIFTLNGALEREYAGKLDDAEQALPAEFIRVHKSYLVNMQYIDQMETNSILLYQGIQVPISRKQMAETRRRYLIYRGMKL